MDPRAQAELYAMLHRGNPGDVAFYRRVCEGAEHVLELGTGGGRIALPLARAGHQVVGLDLDEHLLTLAREAAAGEPPEVGARLSWVHGDMVSTALDRSFDRILVPYNALCCLLSTARVLECLRHIGRHLAPGARLAFDTYEAEHLHTGEEEEEGDDDFEPVVSLEGSLGLLDVFEKSTWERSAQRLDTTYRFSPRAGGSPIEQTIEQRYLLVDELAHLLADAGFRVIELAGGFRGEPLDDEAEHLVVVAEQVA